MLKCDYTTEPTSEIPEPSLYKIAKVHKYQQYHWYQQQCRQLDNVVQVLHDMGILHNQSLVLGGQEI